MKKGFCTTLGILVVIALTVVAFSNPALAREKKYHWKISHMRPEGATIDKDLHWFADQIYEASDGRITIDVYPANQLGDYTVVQERVSVGAIEMACQSLSTSRNPKLQIQYMPYLAKDWEEAKVVFGADSPVIKSIQDMLLKEDVVGLVNWPVYFGGIATVKAAQDPATIGANKMTKIRVPSIRVFTLLTREWGYQGTPIPWADLFTSMQTGIVDGAIGAGAEGYYSNFRDIIKYYYAVNDHFENWFLIMNKDLWESLSEDDKNLIMKYAKELHNKRFMEAEKEEGNYMNMLAERGVEIVKFSSEELGAFAENSRSKIWPQLKEDIGAELIDGCLKYIEEK
ncbi:MAG: TRAP transporter substrate-binding protein DctP [Aminobacterium sp.]|jgi:TRAP-type C4-dicarboxylate transport system substrate-binding protein|uniref:TRAP transporter substrate-binding protein DctP n=1 Tax=Aminobacterium sp. MB27-C1 TaxID=3070661 RepID=UPI001BCC89AA|nr:TRAP transporter substrate-binding protein DctP [Aminobacterium sp. MB27-C1]MDD2207309.1 TRAP transporter substrate-binding protein DctP [Aminobacterium sp.]MDD3426525.1 TRAP transporter substrate-binding protein DctP [Aminobacterium sp.]MDD3707398.1 TRAP transporter substrate-binding protein DctP [Aminobacterium sp.]MDD4229400.1 TRAP transporter substrate-binding protein DctP [Aminobacterium sp.]MDD4552242.1 TRAP transporter substrate-binding protein DctP [Aminobacterium sp.]